jgi:hypothetical protein
MYHFKNLLVIVGIILLHQSAMAQSTCSDQLRLAERRYDSGLLDDIPSILGSCLDRGFTKAEKTTAYKLLIQTYLFSDMPEKADEMMLMFLREFPDYTITPNDHSEFISLHRTYRTTPIMKIEASAGANLSLPWVMEYYGPENLNQHNALYSSSSGAIVEGNYIDNLFGDFDISLGLSFSLSRIGYFNDIYDYTTITATFNKTYIGLPLALRYNKKLLGVNLFAKGGFEPVFMLTSSINFTRERSTGQDPIIGTENVISYQKRVDIRPLLSVGADFNLWGAQLLVTAGFRFGTVNPTQKQLRYMNEDLFQKYYFIPDDYLSHQTFISLSYVFSVYNPKKML